MLDKTASNIGIESYAVKYRNTRVPDKYALEHLIPITDVADTYLCGVAKNNKDEYIYSVNAKVKLWVLRNGGSYSLISDAKEYLGEKKGFVVRIVFPTHNRMAKKDMKELMATLYK